ILRDVRYSWFDLLVQSLVPISKKEFHFVPTILNNCRILIKTENGQGVFEAYDYSFFTKIKQKEPPSGSSFVDCGLCGFLVSVVVLIILALSTKRFFTKNAN